MSIVTRLVASSALVLGVSAVGVYSPVGVAQASDSGTCPTAAGAYAGGTGTSGDPFLIDTPEQFQRLRDTSADWNDAVKLTSDIDMGGCVWGTTLGDTRVSGTGWRGAFDGDGHTISGLDIDIVGNLSVGYAGLFAYLGTGASVTGVGFTGNVSLVVTSTGDVDAYVGGITGFTLGVPISDSFATGDVTVQVDAGADGGGDARIYIFAGGLVGLSQGNVTDSYATGDVSTEGNAIATGSGNATVFADVGGLIGGKALANFSSSYATGSVTSLTSALGGSSQTENSDVGGLIGYRNGVTNANETFWNEETSGLNVAVGNGVSTGITGLTSAQLSDFATFGPAGANWDIADGYSAVTIWSMCSLYNSGFPFLSAFVTSEVCDPPVPPTPPAPRPASAPQDVAAEGGDGSALISWAVPASSGSFPVTTYQVQSTPSSAGCVVPAATLSCEISGLRNGVEYSLRVRALTGAGWGVWSSSVAVVPEPPAPEPSILISGSRSGGAVVVDGVTTGLVGAEVTPWFRFPGPHSYEAGTGVRTVSADGTFTWQRVTAKKIYVYFRSGEVRSNRVIIR